jgi:hypothetical protein
MWLVPALFLLEGCNQVEQLYSYKLFQGICVAISSWIAIIMGAGLWVAIINSATVLICLVIFIVWKYKNFFMPMLSYNTVAVINWRNSLWPMQWRIALSWISGYFLSSFFTPLLFHYHGSVVAGQFGMTWALFGAISSIANMWIAPKIPQFGIFIARKDYAALDKLFFRASKLSVGIFALGAFTFWIVIYCIYKIDFPLVSQIAVRLISPLPAGIFLVGWLFVYFTGPFSYYLRAHNKEPMLEVGVLSAIAVASTSWFLVEDFSILGLSIAYSVVAIFFSFPYSLIVWHRFREKWHREEIHSSISALKK